jgi:hypothetical protein
LSKETKERLEKKKITPEHDDDDEVRKTQGRFTRQKLFKTVRIKISGTPIEFYLSPRLKLADK